MSHAQSSAAETLTDRVAANRSNARRSTGPRTPEGRAVSRGNALRHGLYARVLADAGPWLEEEPGAFEALHRRLIEKYAPQDVEEEKMVERLALLWTRLDRLSLHAQRRLAAGLAPHTTPGLLPEGEDLGPEGDDPLRALMQCEAVATAEARLERSISRLQKDLAFLARYRQRNEEATDKRQAEGVAEPETEGREMLEAPEQESKEPAETTTGANAAFTQCEETRIPSIAWSEFEGTNPNRVGSGNGAASFG